MIKPVDSLSCCVLKRIVDNIVAHVFRPFEASTNTCSYRFVNDIHKNIHIVWLIFILLS